MSKQPIIAATSPRLGEYLSAPREAIEGALSRQSEAREEDAGRRLGASLLDTGAVTLTSLLDAIKAQRMDRLKACPLFASLAFEELADLTAVFQEVSVEAGRQFITQDDKDPCVYVLASGRLEVFRLNDLEEEVKLATVFPGEPVGEMGYFSDGIRSASVRSLDTCQLLRASYADLTDLFETVPGVAVAFLNVVTYRLRRSNLLYQEQESQHHAADQVLAHLAGYVDLTKARVLSTSIDTSIERLVFGASRLTDADRATLFLVDPKTGELWSKVAQGAEIREIRVAAGSGIVGWVVENEEMLNIADAYQDERFNQAVDTRTGYRTSTILCAPVKSVGGPVVGAIQVLNKQLGIFNEDDESLLRAFADQAAVALEHINLYREVVTGHERMAKILSVATVISESATLEDLMIDLGVKLTELFPCAHAALYAIDNRSNAMWTVAQVEGERTTTRLPVTASLIGHTVSTGEFICVADAYEDARFDRNYDDATGDRTRSQICVAVLDRQQRPWGGLTISNKSGGVFDLDDAEFAKAVAAQLAGAALLNR